jgi:16S rRNA (guanine(966)-N(2))-methyltransferase RsmD
VSQPLSKSAPRSAKPRAAPAAKVKAKARGKAAPKPVLAAPAPARSKTPNEVRLIGGQLRRSKLPVADKPGLRPTPDRVRETLFNWLGADLSGWRCLDAFAGSGALGFEAASRGAAEVLLLERDPSLVTSLRASQQRLKVDPLRVEACDALVWMTRCAPARFELVLLDPPFDADLLPRALAAAAPLVVEGGLVYAESDTALNDCDLPAGLAVVKHGRAGSVHYHLLRRSSPRSEQ